MTTRMAGDKRREMIVAAATELFHRHGYTETSIEDIMSKVGTTAAAYYYYYDSKEDVLVHILDRAMSEVENGVEQLGETRPLTAAGRLHATLSEHAAAVASNAAIASVLFAETHKVPSDTVREIRTRMAAYTDDLIELYALGIKEGELRPIDPALAIHTLLGIVNWVAFWYSEERHPAPDDLGNLVMDLAAEGFRITTVPTPVT